MVNRGSAFVWLIFLAAMAALVFVGMGIAARPSGILQQTGAKYVILDIAKHGFRVTPELAAGMDGRESFESMIKNRRPIAAITGTYFDEKSRPMGDIVRDGKVCYRGGQRRGIGFTRNGKMVFYLRRGSHKIKWTGCYSGIACGPNLVRLGKLDIDARRDGFSTAAEGKEASRCAVGADKSGRLIFCCVEKSITLKDMGKVMLALGAKDAINMDGGASCALYANGKYLVKPYVPLSNIIAVYIK